jgi:hypothetical protein
VNNLITRVKEIYINREEYYPYLGLIGLFSFVASMPGIVIYAILTA